MNDQNVREYSLHAASTETFGRVLTSTRNHHFIVDGPVQNGCPGEALTPVELFLAGGLLLAAVGILRIRDGDQVLTHWTGQPLFSWGLIAAGGICILLAVVPSSWIAKAITTRNGKAHSE